MEFWFEDEKGLREPLAVANELEALQVARKVYAEADWDPTKWLVKQMHIGEEDFILVPGGPGGEEFTWMPRSMWSEGGVMSLVD